VISHLMSLLPGVFSFRTFRILLLLLTGCAILLLVMQAWHFLPVTGENVYPESSGVLSALRWSRGLPLYQDFRKAPYLTTPFPPLWFALMAETAKVTGADMDSLTGLGRIFSLLCLFGIAIAGYFWNRSLGLPRALSILAPAFFLSVPILVPWAVTARPDLLALLLSFVAVYASANSASIPGIALASGISSLAFLSRHNSVAAPVAIVVWLVFSRRWKHAFLFCGVWGSIVGPVLAFFQMTSGGSLSMNLAGGKFGKVSMSYARDVLARFLEAPGQAFVLALFVFGLYGLFEALRQDDRRLHLLCLYAIVALMLAIMGSAAAGSAPNHYLETALAFSFLIPIGLLSIDKSWVTGSPLAILTTIFVLIVLVPSLDVLRSTAAHNHPDDLRFLTPIVAGRHVFTDLPYVAARESQPEALDLASLINSERSNPGHGWSSSVIVHDLSERKYALVVLSQPIEEVYVPAGLYPRYPRMDESMRSAIRQNYGLCSHTVVSYIYAPLTPEQNLRCPAGADEASRTLVQRTP
jgi:hypothetical protein